MRIPDISKGGGFIRKRGLHWYVSSYDMYESSSFTDIGRPTRHSRTPRTAVHTSPEINRRGRRNLWHVHWGAPGADARGRLLAAADQKHLLV